MTLTLCAVLAMVVFFALVASYDYYENKTGVPVFPSMPAVRKKIVALLRGDADQRKEARPYHVLDLGSGSGQLSRHIALALPEAQVTGIELSYIPWARSCAWQKLFGPRNLEYRRGDFWLCDIANADAVITYLPGKIMERVGEKLHRELRPDSLVIANTFPLRDSWIPEETMTLHAPFKTNLYLYRQTRRI